MNSVPECTEYNISGEHRKWHKIFTTFSQVLLRFFLAFRVDHVTFTFCIKEVLFQKS